MGMELNKPSATCQALNSAVSLVLTFFNLLLVDTWDVSAYGPNPLLRSLTPSTETTANVSQPVQWLMLTWRVSSTPMKSKVYSSQLNLDKRNTCVRRILFVPSRPSTNLTHTPLLLVVPLLKPPVLDARRKPSLPSVHNLNLSPHRRRLSMNKSLNKEMSAKMALASNQITKQKQAPPSYHPTTNFQYLLNSQYVPVSTRLLVKL